MKNTAAQVLSVSELLSAIISALHRSDSPYSIIRLAGTCRAYREQCLEEYFVRLDNIWDIFAVSLPLLRRADGVSNK